MPVASIPKINLLKSPRMTSPAGLFPTQPEPSPSLLLEWLRRHGAHVSDGIEVYESENGWGVRATRFIEFDELRMYPFHSFFLYEC